MSQNCGVSWHIKPKVLLATQYLLPCFAIKASQFTMQLQYMTSAQPLTWFS